MNHLYFAAKAPLAGEAKTRLGMSIGMNAAANLYSAFVLDLAARFDGVGYPTGWYVAPGARSHLLPFIGSSARVRTQRGDTWAERQANLFKDCAADHEAPVVLAATDSPQLPRARVEEAFTALRTHDTVLGPTDDGGYYLIGMRGFHNIVEDVEMSTSSALEQMLARAASQRVSVALLRPEFDVDTEDDLAHLENEVGRRRDLPHTAEALALIRGAAQGSRIA